MTDRLKPFQRATVEHAFRRLYTDPDHATHFLVADEVGLGKTLVAQGVIARAVDYLASDRTKKGKPTDRIDVVYLCSSQSIAAQNLKKLGHGLPAGTVNEQRLPDRLTLLPLAMDAIEAAKRGKRAQGARRVNFFSLTPGTSFKMGHAMGRQDERVFLYHLLVGSIDGKNGFMSDVCQRPKRVHADHPNEYVVRPLARMLRGGVGGDDDDWYQKVAADTRARQAIEHFGRAKRTRAETLLRPLEGVDLYREFVEIASQYPTRKNSEPDDELKRRVRRAVKLLRARTARAAVELLEPDLIIMDEFQRFTDLLRSGKNGGTRDDVAELVEALTSFRDEETGEPVRMLLLSATPYRQLTLDTDGTDGDMSEGGGHEDADEDANAAPTTGTHRDDFIGTLRILFKDGDEVVAEIESELSKLRAALEGLPNSYDTAVASRTGAEERLRRAIARTERVDTSDARDSMVIERTIAVDLRVEDLRDARALMRLAEQADATNPVRFWKSSPYLLSFMRDYDLLRKVEALRDAPDACADAKAALDAAVERTLRWDDVQRYRPIEACNGRLRALKRLVFEPDDRGDASHDARVDVSDGADVLAGRIWMPPNLPYVLGPGGRVGPGEGDRPAGERASKALVFSSWQVVPDMAAALVSYEAERRGGLGDRGRHYEEAFDRARTIEGGRSVLAYPSPTLAALVDPLVLCHRDGLTTLDVQRDAVVRTLREHFAPKRRSARQTLSGPEQVWRSILEADGEGLKDGHVSSDYDLLSEANRADDLSDDRGYGRLATFALAAPGTVALRSLMRVIRGAGTDREMTDAARRIGAAIVRAMRRPLNAAHVLGRAHGRDTGRWVTLLRYAALNDLQAVMDEWLHLIANDETTPTDIAGAVERALNVHQSAISVRDWRAPGDSRPRIMRGHVAMRLASASGDGDSGGVRVGAVKDTFCSPFAPFVLTSTSVGQEGLDFHLWCSRVIHWNIPTNPTDLEQREGRVHRFKGHALRRNLVDAYADVLKAALKDLCNEPTPDPWSIMFEEAERASTGGDGRVPSWVLEGSSRVERVALIPPFSRDRGRYERVRQDLTVYRLAFGQARQDDLLEHLRSVTADGSLTTNGLDELQITLRPSRMEV